MKNKLILWSTMFLFGYVVIRFLSGTVLSFIPIPLVLINIFGKHLLVVITLVIIFLYQKANIVTTLSAILISLCGYGFDFLFKINNPLPQLVIYRDSVMGSIDIAFYKDKHFRIIESSLLGDKHYKGTYQLKNDTITLDKGIDLFSGCNQFILSKEFVTCAINEKLTFYIMDNPKGYGNY